jgi:hypothetical protein
MSGNFVANNCRLIPTRLGAGTSLCYTAAGFPQVIGVRIVNFHTSATPRVSLTYYKATNSMTHWLQANLLIPVAGAIWLPYEGFAMYENDQLLAACDTANAIDILLFLAEVPGRNQ